MKKEPKKNIENIDNEKVKLKNEFFKFYLYIYLNTFRLKYPWGIEIRLNPKSLYFIIVFAYINLIYIFLFLLNIFY